MEKKILREKFKQIRNKYPKNLKDKKNEAILKIIENLNEYKKSKTIMTYVSFSSEVETKKLIKKMFDQKKRVVVPLIQNKKIIPIEIKNLKDLKKGKYGILEPTNRKHVKTKNIDLVFVPGIVFDKTGHRIGFGGGYYDKFLKKIPLKKRIGLCFSFQLINKIPADPKDLKVNKIITEKGVILC